MERPKSYSTNKKVVDNTSGSNTVAKRYKDRYSPYSDYFKELDNQKVDASKVKVISNDYFKTPDVLLDESLTKKQARQRAFYGTAADVIGNVAGGFTNVAESLISAVPKAGIAVADLFGADVSGAKDFVTKYEHSISNAILEGTTLTDQYSVNANKLDTAWQGVGNTAAYMATGGMLAPVKVAGMSIPAASLISGASSGLSEAWEKGADDWQAVIKSAGSGLVEGISESIFETFGQGGSSVSSMVDNQLDKLRQSTKSVLAYNLAKMGVSAAGEGAEEILSSLGNYGVDKIADLAAKETSARLSEGETFEQAFIDGVDSGISAALSTILSGGAQASISTLSGRYYDSGMSPEEYKEYNKIVDTYYADVEKQTGKKLTDKEKSEINDFAFDSYFNAGKKLDKTSMNYDSYGEKGKSLIDSAEAADANNTKYTKDKIAIYAKLADKFGLDLEYTSNEQLIKDGKYELKDGQLYYKTQDGKLKKITVNGFNNGQKAVFNIDSKKSMDFVYGHEIGHFIAKNEKSYNTLKNLLFETAKANGEYDTRLADIQKIYEGTEFNAEEELFSDLLGDYIFNNDDFIKKIATKKTLATKIKSALEELRVALVGTDQEKRIVAVQKKLEDALNEVAANKKVESKTQNSFTGEVGLENIKESMPDVYNFENQKLNEAKTLKENGINERSIYEQTGWFYADDKKWKHWTDINRDVIEENIQDNIENAPSNTTVSSILNTYNDIDYDALSTLEKMYPEIGNINVEFKDEYSSDTAAYYSQQENKIVIYALANRYGDYKESSYAADDFIHELEHAIQRYEGFQRGSNFDKELDNVNRRINYDRLNIKQDIINHFSKKNNGYFNMRNADIYFDELFRKVSELENVSEEEYGTTGEWLDKYSKVIDKFGKELYQSMTSYYAMVEDPNKVAYLNYFNNLGEKQARASERLTRDKEKLKDSSQINIPYHGIVNDKYSLSQNGIINEEINDEERDFRRLQEQSQRVLDQSSWGSESRTITEEERARLADVFRRKLERSRDSSSNNNRILKLKNYNVYENVDGQTFHDIFSTIRTYTDYGELVDIHPVNTEVNDGYETVGYNDTYNYMSEDGLSGFAITKDGDLISVFNASDKKGWLDSVAPIIKEKAKTLDCYFLDPKYSGTNLVELYEKKLGFRLSRTEKYDWSYDHDDIGERYKEPMIAYLYNPKFNKLSDNENDYGYHYGAEKLDYTKKSDVKGSMIGRDTGYLGTGTYFFGSQKVAKENGYYNKNEHKVDFSMYNLFKMKSKEDGERFHDFFKGASRYYRQDYPTSIEEYNKEINNIAESIDRTEEWLESNIVGKSWDEYFSRKEQGEEVTHDEIYEKMYQDFFEMSEEQLSTIREELSKYFTDSDIDEMFEASLDINDKVDSNYLHDEILNNYTDDENINAELIKRTNQYFTSNIDYVANMLDISREKLIGLVNMYDTEMKNDDFYSDSLPTRVMKHLGYEGIDVRGIEGLDNAYYGSVIYDLSPRSVAYSLSQEDNPEYDNYRQQTFDDSMVSDEVEEYEDKFINKELWNIINSTDSLLTSDKLAKIDEYYAKNKNDTLKKSQAQIARHMVEFGFNNAQQALNFTANVQRQVNAGDVTKGVNNIKSQLIDAIDGDRRHLMLVLKNRLRYIQQMASQSGKDVKGLEGITFDENNVDIGYFNDAQANEYNKFYEESLGTIKEPSIMEELMSDEVNNEISETERRRLEKIDEYKAAEEKYARQNFIEQETIKPNSDKRSFKEILSNDLTTAKKYGKKFIKEIVDKGYIYKNNPHLYASYNNMSRAYNQARTWLTENSYKDGKVSGRSYNDIVAPYRKNGTQDDFHLYLALLRNKDGLTLKERGFGENVGVWGDKVDLETTNKLLAEMDKKFPDFKESAKEMTDFLFKVMDNEVEGGLYTKESAEYLKAKWEHYFPMTRTEDPNVDNQAQFQNRAYVKEMLKKMEGSTIPLASMDSAVENRVYGSFRNIARNNFFNELNKTSELPVIYVEDVDGEGYFTNNSDLEIDKDGQYIGKFVDKQTGEKKTVEISKDIYDSLAKTEYENIGILHAVTNLKKNLITQNILYGTRNFIRDFQDAPANTKYIKTWYTTMPTAIKQMANNGELWQLYKSLGGYVKSESSIPSGLANNKAVSEVIKRTDKLSELNDLIEAFPRFNEFINSIDAGNDYTTALHDAAEVTTDFSKGGDTAKFINNNISPFFNSSVQGAYKLYRNIEEVKKQGAVGVAKYAAKLGILYGIPALLLNGLVWDDDEEYDELSDYIKENYYIVGKIGDGKFIRIPKGRLASFLQTVVGNVGKTITGEKSVWDAMQSDWESFIDNVAPNNPIDTTNFAPLIQAATNTTWYGEDLIPSRLQDVPAEEQYDETTDIVSKFIGQKTGISPYKINYVIDQYSGGLGDILLPYLTPKAETSSLLLSPLESQFTTDSVMKNQNISAFYDLKDELYKNNNSLDATDEEILSYRFMSQYSSQMSDLYQQKREIQNSSLGNKEKYEAVRDIQDQINELAKYALNNYDQIDVYQDYAQVGNIEYYKNTSGKWTKIDDDTVSEMNELNMSTKQKADYYAAKSEISGIASQAKKDSEENKDKSTEISNKKKLDIATVVQSSNLTDEQKYYLYSKSYSSNALTAAKTMGISANSFIEYDSQSFSGKYKKQSMWNYISNMSGLTNLQKAMLFKLEYSSYHYYDKQIVNEILNTVNVSKQREEMLGYFGFKVNSNGSITRK